MVKSCLFWDTWSFPHQPIHYSRAPPNHRGCRTTRRCPWARHHPPSPGCRSRKADMAQANMHCMGNRSTKRLQPTASMVSAMACTGLSWHCWCWGAWGIGNRSPSRRPHCSCFFLFNAALKAFTNSPLPSTRRRENSWASIEGQVKERLGTSERKMELSASCVT